MTRIVFLIATIIVSCSAITAQTNVIDNKGTRRNVDTSKWSLSGSDIRSKNTGNVGIGVSSPSSKLDVNGSLRVRNSSVKIDSLQGGSLSDSLVVWRRGDSVLRKVSAASVRTIASNGVSNGANGDSVILGGALNRATTLTQNSQPLTIATGGAALNITGLTTGSLQSDSVLLVDATTGRIKRTSYSFPDILVSASRTTSYTITASPSYAILPYNSASINIGSAYNTTTGVFTAPSTGVYQVLVHNMLTTSSPVNTYAFARIVVNGTVDLEVASAITPYAGTVFGTISANTIVNVTAGQTINIQMGNAVGPISPSVGSNQHTLKIIRLR